MHSVKFLPIALALTLAGLSGHTTNGNAASISNGGAPAVPAPTVTAPVRLNLDTLLVDNMAQPGTQAQASLAANPSNPDNLVAVWQENRFPDGAGGARALGYAATFDGGQTWSTGLLPQITEVNGGPWKRVAWHWVAFGLDNRVYAVAVGYNNDLVEQAIELCISTDGGSSWAPPVHAVRSAATGENFNGLAIAVDTVPQSQFFGNVYLTWTDQITGKSHSAVVAISIDGGATFGRRVKLRGSVFNINTRPQVGPGGALYVIWEGQKGAQLGITYLFFRKSVDGGVTWSKSKTIAKRALKQVPNLRTGFQAPSFAISRRDGTLYAVYEDLPNGSVNQVMLRVSHDAGETWSDAVRVGDGPGGAATFTGVVATNDNGDVAVSYFSLENDPARSLLVDGYLRVSVDGGATFAPSTRVTPESFDMRFAAESTAGLFVGDYEGLAGTDTTFHLVWVDTSLTSPSTGRRQSDVFAAHTQ